MTLREALASRMATYCAERGLPNPLEPRPEGFKRTLGQIVLENTARYDLCKESGIWPEVPLWSEEADRP